MLSVFNFFQTIGFFGFSNWLPSLLMAQGHDVSKSLFYSFCIAWAYPLTPLRWGATIAERSERKWLIVASAAGMAATGLLFAATTNEILLVALGIAVTSFATLLSMSYHPYQAELFSTEIRGSCLNAWCRSAGSGSPGRGWAACQTAAGGRLTGAVSLNGASVSRLI